MQRSDSSSERGDTRGGRLVVTDAARDAVGRLCRDHGRQALLLCWPGGAVCLPLSLYPPAAFDLIIGHIARCPSHVDARQLRFTAGSHAVLDATQPWKQRPLRRPRARPPRACTWTAHRGGAAMTTATFPQVAARVSRGLHHELAGVLAEPVSTACPRDTVSDLPGSIDGEALPQMAARLATARLTAIAQARRHPGTAIRSWVDRSSARRRSARPRRRPDRREQQ